MSGFLPGIAQAQNIASLVRGSVSPPRFVLVPVTDESGNPVTNADGTPQTRPFDAYVAMSEAHDDEMEITDHPVAQGTNISDHAFALPNTLTMILAWSPASPSLNGNPQIFGFTLPTLSGLWNQQNGQAKLRTIYSTVLSTMQSKKLCSISTGKRAYANMLIKGVRENTEPDTENVLSLTITFRQMILASVTTVNSPINTAPGAQANPQSTTPPVSRGSVAPVPNSTPTPAETVQT